MKFLKFTVKNISMQSRDRRELSAALELGCSITVFCSACEDDQAGILKQCNVITLPRPDYRAGRNVIKQSIVFLRYCYELIRKVATIDCDLASCENMSCCLIYCAAYFFRSHKRPPFIYDAHEYELERNTVRKRSAFKKWWVKRLEKYVLKRCAFSIMVNDCIADEVQRIHRLPERSVVVRSTPTRWHLDEAAIAETRKDILKQLDLPADTFIVMYHGMLMKNRGIESMLQAVAQTQNTAAVILGDCQEPAFASSLRLLCDTLKIEERVLFLPAVPLDTLSGFVGAADVGAILNLAETKNYYYVLPNKFFENIQSLTPVICSDLPELARLVNQYDIGVLVDPNSIACVARAIEHMRDDKDAYAQYKRNLAIAKDELCWEKEKQTLIAAYADLIRKLADKEPDEDRLRA